MLTPIAENIYQVSIPIPFPLKTVNCYLVRDPAGWVMIDSGMRTPAGLAAWDEAFRELGMTPEDLRRIYVTHLHPDHFGLAGYFQQLSGAPVYMLRLEAERISLFWNTNGPTWRSMAAQWTRNGMPAELAAQADLQEQTIIPALLPYPEITPLDEDDVVELGGQPYCVVWTPGHSDGHYVLHGFRNRFLFAGDHLLARITPNIGLWPHSNPDPLGSYLASLHKVAHLDVDLALPGHRAVIADVRGRVGELLAHHDLRAAQCEALIDGGNTAYAICQGVFGTHLAPHDVRFAMAETLAHLEYLARLGRVERVENGIVTYHRHPVREMFHAP